MATSINLSVKQWRTIIGPSMFFEMSEACEVGPSVDAANMIAANALNAAVNIGLMKLPPTPKPIAFCPECDILIAFVTDDVCDACEEEVEMLPQEIR